MKKFITTVFALGSFVSSIAFVKADILPTGQKVVSVCASIANISDFKEYVIFSYLTAVNGQSSSPMKLSDGQCLDLGYKANQVDVYAMTPAHFEQISKATNYDPTQDSNIFKASTELDARETYVDANDPLDNVKKNYKIIDVDPTKKILNVYLEGQVYYYNNGNAPKTVTYEPNNNTPNKIFSDVKIGDLYYDALTYLKNNKVIEGYGDGTFKPNNLINRAEFTKMVIRPMTEDIGGQNGCLNYIFESATPISKVEIFKDIVYDTKIQNSWYIDFVCEAKTLNLIQGYPDGTFRPDQPINFVEAAKIILKHRYETLSQSDPWYKTYVDKLSDINAIPVSIKFLNQQITRGEMAEIIYRLQANFTNLPSNHSSDLH